MHHRIISHRQNLDGSEIKCNSIIATDRNASRRPHLQTGVVEERDSCFKNKLLVKEISLGKKLYVEHKMLVSVIQKEFPQTDKETIQREKGQRVENEKLNRDNPKR